MFTFSDVEFPQRKIAVNLPPCSTLIGQVKDVFCRLSLQIGLFFLFRLSHLPKYSLFFSREAVLEYPVHTYMIFYDYFDTPVFCYYKDVKDHIFIFGVVVDLILDLITL
jgi:hypothetical protein